MPVNPYGAAAGGLGTAQLARVLGEPEEPGAFGRFARWLGRPGYMLRSALTLDPEGFVKNLGMFMGGIGTAGLLPIPELTTREQRPEFTDLLGTWGVGGLPEEGSWGRLGLDVAGGILTDPLTALTFGGGGIAKGGLTAVGRAEAGMRLAKGLTATKGGKAALEASEARVLSRMASRDSPFGRRVAAAGPTPTAESMGMTAENFGAFQRTVTKQAAEDVFGQYLPGFRRFGLGPQPVQLDDGIRALEEAQLLVEHGSMRIANFVPIVGGKKLMGDFWGRTARWGTVPGLAREAGKRWKPNAVDRVDYFFAEKWSDLKGLYDKTLKGLGVPEGLRTAARAVAAEHAARDVNSQRLVEEIWGGWSEAERVSMGASFKLADDAYQEGLFSGLAEPAARLRANQLLADAISTSPELAGKLPDEIATALQRYQRSMAEIPRELKWLGVWKQARENPFYLPQQATQEIADLLGNAHAYHAMGGKHSAALRSGIKDVFANRRYYKTTDEFLEKLREVADRYDVPVDGPERIVLMDTDIGYLQLKRLVAHNRTVHRAKLYQAAKRIDPELRVGDALDTYVQAQLQPVMRRTTLQKILGGGWIGQRKLTGAPNEDYLRGLARKSPGLYRVRKDVDGNLIWEQRFRGLNFLYKPALTLPFPAFHVRNSISSTVMSLFDPDMGFGAGFRALASVFANAPAVALGAKAGWKKTEIASFVRALDGDAAAIAAVQDLKVGTYSGAEVLEHMKGFLGGRLNQVDLMQRVGKFDRLARDLGRTKVLGPREGAGLLSKPVLAQLANAFDKFVVEIGSDVANHIESSFRAATYMELLKKGVSPVESMRRTQRMFVDYSVQSAREQLLRDVIPFARFQIGSAAWLEEFAKRPITVSPVAQAYRSAQGGTEPGMLPEMVRESIAAPAGTLPSGAQRYLMAGGLFPQEASVGLLGATRPLTFARRGVLAGAHPLIRLPAEAVMGRSAYFGTEFGGYRRAPAWLPDAFTTEVGKEGKKRREISGVVNEILNAAPTSRALKTIDSFLDKRKTGWDALLRNVVGARVVEVDTDRAAREILSAWLRERVRTGEVGELPVFFSRMENPPEDLKVALQTLRGLRKKE